MTFKHTVVDWPITICEKPFSHYAPSKSNISSLKSRIHNKIQVIQWNFTSNKLTSFSAYRELLFSIVKFRNPLSWISCETTFLFKICSKISHLMVEESDTRICVYLIRNLISNRHQISLCHLDYKEIDSQLGWWSKSNYSTTSQLERSELLGTQIPDIKTNWVKKKIKMPFD